MLHRSTIQLLRFHFSFFLLPVFLFAISQVSQLNVHRTWLCFFILHFLVYPSSNGYNSYMDRDEGAIGGLERPLQPTRQLFYVSVIIDVLALILSITMSWIFMVGILLYIIASRAYSYRGIRLKRFPVTGFLTVFIFQGALIFFSVYHVCSFDLTMDVPLLPCVIASLLIGALYPLTQIYQHEADQKEGVTTISYLLGKRGSFIFSMLLFLLATALLFLRFYQLHEVNYFYLFLLIMFPVVLFFLYWMMMVWKNAVKADFKNSLRMNLLSTLCTTAFFLTLFVIRH